ncbi:MAG: hypothetical protein ACE5OZ_23215 [Candidatus Heimdallarchaeota archaeon]
MEKVSTDGISREELTVRCFFSQEYSDSGIKSLAKIIREKATREQLDSFVKLLVKK